MKQITREGEKIHDGGGGGGGKEKDGTRDGGEEGRKEDGELNASAAKKTDTIAVSYIALSQSSRRVQPNTNRLEPGSKRRNESWA
jgi:hypothetical protein